MESIRNLSSGTSGRALRDRPVTHLRRCGGGSVSPPDRRALLVTLKYRLAGAPAAMSLLLVLGVCATEPARAQAVVLRNKPLPESKYPMTSIRVKTNSPDTKPNAPGWTPKQEFTRTGAPTTNWTLAGGSLAPGEEVTIGLTNPFGTAKARIVGADYKNAQGIVKWAQLCSDPISATVVAGGESGATYLGYAIAPNEYGYFYQMWNPAGFTDQTKRAEITIGTDTGSYGFAVIANSFEFLPGPGFDLQDLVVWSSVPENSPYDIQHYMEAEDARGIPGVEPLWEFNPVTGIAAMTFFPGDPGHGLGSAETGSIVAYASPNPPGLLSDEPNVDVTYVGTLSCPRDFILVPTPEPSALLLLALGGLLLIRARPG